MFEADAETGKKPKNIELLERRTDPALPQRNMFDGHVFVGGMVARGGRPGACTDGRAPDERRAHGIWTSKGRA